MPSYLRGSVDVRRAHLRRLPAVPDRASRSRSRCCSSLRSNTRASARRCAPRSTTSAWRAASASMSTRAFAITFALGSGLAGLGGALAIEIVGLDPTFAFTYLVYVLIVVVGRRARLDRRLVRGRGAARHQRHRRQVLRSRARRVPHLPGDGRAADVAAGRPVREAVMMAVRQRGHRRTPICRRQARWRPIEIAFWLATLLPFWLVPELSRRSRARSPSRRCSRSRSI